MEIPAALTNAIERHTNLSLELGNNGVPYIYAEKDTAEVLWNLPEFTLESAAYLVDNYLEVYGYTPLCTRPDKWTWAYLDP